MIKIELNPATVIECIETDAATGARWFSRSDCVNRVPIREIPPTVQVTRRERAGCTPQPSYIHGPWVTIGTRQPLYTRSK